MKLYKLSAFALSSLMLVGCADLDTEPKGSTITDEQKQGVVENNPEMVSASVAGISQMFIPYMATGSYHNDFGYGSVMLFTDSRGMDMVGMDTGYNWFSGGLNLTDDRSYTSYYNAIVWNNMYNQIYTANLVAKTLGVDASNVSTKDGVTQFYAAQAFAVRAFDYFILAQLYQFTYKGNEEKPCVPLITDKNQDDAAANGIKRTPVKEVYAQIINDLDLAVTCLKETSVVREDKRYVNLATALGLRARVKLVMNDWDGAKNDATDAIASAEAEGLHTASIADVKKPTFKSAEESDWVWAIKVAETDRIVTSGIVNWISHMGSLNYGYASVGAWRLINKSLYNSINSSDVRKGWFLNESKTSPNLTAEQQAYLTSAKCPAYTQVKFAPYKDEIYTSTNANDMPLMRIEELYFIKFEATAMSESGSASTAAAELQSYIKAYRDPAYVCTASSKEDVQKAVWMQRRIELWGEGLSYYDIMRLKKGIDRRGSGFEANYVYNINGDDPILIYQIPNAEIEGNPALTEADNNPSCETPTPVSE